MGGYKVSRPPKTTRFCVICNKRTKWKYNPITGHSECSKCGSRFTQNPLARKKRLYWCPGECGRSVIAEKGIGTNYTYQCRRCNKTFKKEELI